jgi:hypothetical protein
MDLRSQGGFQKHGIRNMIGWNTVSPKMLGFAFTASFLKSQEGQSTLVMMFLIELDGEIGSMHINHYLIILVV